MNPNAEKLRKKYMDDPPEGMTSEDIRRMSEEDLLDMDYFLNEDDPFGDDFGEGFWRRRLLYLLNPLPSVLYTQNTYSSNVCSMNIRFSLCRKRTEFPIK